MDRSHSDSRRKPPVELILARLGRNAHGVVTRQDAIRGGISKDELHRQVARGPLVRRFPRTYVLAAVPHTWIQDVTAAVAWAGSPAAASGRSAARILEMAGFDDTEVLELTSTRTLRPPPGVVVHETKRWEKGDVCSVQHLPVTAPTRTLIDLAALVDEETLYAAFDDAFIKGLSDPYRLGRRLRSLGTAGRKGGEVLRRIADESTDEGLPAQSVLERRFQRAAIAARLPEPRRQFPVTANGKQYLVDFAYPEAMVALEMDGWRFHGGRAQWERDIARTNALVALGWRVIRGTWRDLQRDPRSLVEQVRALVLPGLLDGAG